MKGDGPAAHHRVPVRSAALPVAALACALLPAAAWRAPNGAPPPELRRGERQFRVRGEPGFVFGRNPTETTVEAFEARLREMAASGDRLARLHLMHGLPPAGTPGEVDAAWAAKWERVFAEADRLGIGVLPVFTVWAQWSDGSAGETWHVWHDNPYNAALGGPARAPSELLRETACRRVWLRWLAGLVRRWSPHRCIVAWEPISEVDLVTGATPAAAGEFARAAAAAIRAADPRRRPVTVSLSGTRDWPEVFGDPAVDIVQAHPYATDPPYSGQLCDLLLDVTRDRLRRYGKPVLLGECGLDWRPPAGTLTVSPRAETGIRLAIWASVVSGALSGRMLWWEDGYDKYEGSRVAERYRDSSVRAARFVEGIATADMATAAVVASPEVKGAALASASSLVAWFRDARCNPPDWPVRTVEGARVTIAAPGKAARWRVRFTDTVTGAALGETSCTRTPGGLVVSLPAFREAVALRAKALGGR